MNKPTHEIDFGGPIGICRDHRIKAMSFGVFFGRVIRPTEKTGLKGICPLCWAEHNVEKVEAAVGAGRSIKETIANKRR